MKYFSFIFAISNKHKSKEFVSILEKLESKYSKIEAALDIENWKSPVQYEKEMGNNLQNKLILFKDKLSLKDLISLKKDLEKIEKETSKKNKRKYNLNPGYKNKHGVFALTHKANKERKRRKIDNNVYVEKQLDYKINKYGKNKNSFDEYIKSIKIFNSK